MFKGRRVGTLTAGITLILFGLLFLARILFPVITLKAILPFWPLIFILMGIEILAAYIINRDEKMRYDVGAVVLLVLLSCFAFCMAGAEFLINYPGLKVNI